MLLDMTTKGRPSTTPRTAFGERLAEARENAGLSQAELGKKLGITQRAIAHWERKNTALRPEQLKSLAEILDISIDQLISGNKVKTKKATPQGKVKQVFDAVSKLPRRQQEKIIDVLQPFIAQHSK